VVLLVALVLAACAGDGETKREPIPAPRASDYSVRVFFTGPATGAKVTNPVHVGMRAEGISIEPAGEVRPGAGHFHISVDSGCLAAGQFIPNDSEHLHYDQGQQQADLVLPPGLHSLCLQLGDGANTALNATDTLVVDVIG
jgi:hypothetical protein